MKKSNNIALLIAGIVLFVLAGFVSVSLLLTVFDFGGQNPANSTVFYQFGKKLTDFYGFSSVLIPVFFISAAYQCYAAKWTAKNGVILLGSVVPFFTIVALEKIIRDACSSDSDPSLFVKILAILTIGIMVLVAEYLILALAGSILSSSEIDDEEKDDLISDSPESQFSLSDGLIPGPDEKSSENPDEKDRTLVPENQEELSDDLPDSDETDQFKNFSDEEENFKSDATLVPEEEALESEDVDLEEVSKEELSDSDSEETDEEDDDKTLLESDQEKSTDAESEENDNIIEEKTEETQPKKENRFAKFFDAVEKSDMEALAALERKPVYGLKIEDEEKSEGETAGSESPENPEDKNPPAENESANNEIAENQDSQNEPSENQKTESETVESERPETVDDGTDSQKIDINNLTVDQAEKLSSQGLVIDSAVQSRKSEDAPQYNENVGLPKFDESSEEGALVDCDDSDVRKISFSPKKYSYEERKDIMLHKTLEAAPEGGLCEVSEKNRSDDEKKVEVKHNEAIPASQVLSISLDDEEKEENPFENFYDDEEDSIVDSIINETSLDLEDGLPQFAKSQPRVEQKKIEAQKKQLQEQEEKSQGTFDDDFFDIDMNAEDEDEIEAEEEMRLARAADSAGHVAEPPAGINKVFDQMEKDAEAFPVFRDSDDEDELEQSVNKSLAAVGVDSYYEPITSNEKAPDTFEPKPVQSDDTEATELEEPPVPVGFSDYDDEDSEEEESEDLAGQEEGSEADIDDEEESEEDSDFKIDYLLEKQSDSTDEENGDFGAQEVGDLEEPEIEEDSSELINDEDEDFSGIDRAFDEGGQALSEIEDDEERTENQFDSYQFNPTAKPVVDSEGNPYESEDEDSSSIIGGQEDSLGESDDSEDYDVVDDFDGEDENSEENGVSAEDLAVHPLQEETRRNIGPYKIPSDLLNTYPDNKYWIVDEETKEAGEELKQTLNEFKIEAEVTGIRKGPVVTMFEILPAPGVKLSKIVALQDNIALRLAASSVRIVAPIPGKHAVGIEVPNKRRAIVSFKEIIDQENPAFEKMAVPVILGKDISGEPQIIDLAKTPHLLIAGSTGAGKSVCVNTMLLSILYKRSPQQVKLVLIDPKIVELKLYNDIPHLLTPVITEPKKALQALQYCLCEMERRYALLDGMSVRDIISYNKKITERHIATEKLPYMVVVIDEFADLMATTGKELEQTIARLAAMSRAVGIHLVLATQRPSIDVITGLIKANIPSRIAFMVASKMDSRIIIDQVGAEKLLGKGDMLYSSATDPFPTRIQGTLVSDNEVESVVEYVKHFGEPDYIDDEIFVDDDEEDDGNRSLFDEGEDPLYDQALQIVIQAGKASASYIQRRLKIGYNRAARLVEEMEERGIVGPQNGSKPRQIIHVP